MHGDTITLTPDREERLLLDGLVQKLGLRTGGPAVSAELKLVLASGEDVPLPALLRAAIEVMVRDMAAGKSVTVSPATAEITAQDAANVLNVSRPTLIAMLKSGELQAAVRTTAGGHRRIDRAAVEAHAARQSEVSLTALREAFAEDDDY